MIPTKEVDPQTNQPIYTYTFTQMSEIIPRKDYKPWSDKIVKFDHVYFQKEHTAIVVGVALRQSGCFDVYYSGTRVYSSNSGSTRGECP